MTREVVADGSLPAAPRDLVRWVSGAMRLVVGDTGLTRLEVWAAPADDEPLKLAAFSLGERSASPEELAAELYDAARVDAAHRHNDGRAIVYRVFAFNALEQEHSRATAFKLHGARETAAPFATSALARSGAKNERGMTEAQSLAVVTRGNSDILKTLLENFAPLVDGYRSDATAQRDQVRELMAENYQLRAELARLTQASRAELAQTEIQLLKARQQDQFYQLLMSLGPKLLANALPTSNVGIALAAEGGNPLQHQVQAFTRTLNPNQLVALMKVLSSEQQQMLMAIAGSGVDAEKKDEQRRPEMLRERPYSDTEIDTALDVARH